MYMTRRILAGCVLGLMATSALAADWPMYRGPKGDGKSDEKIAASWPESGPKVLWKNKLGGGVGSMAIVDGKVFVGEQAGEAENLVAYDLKTGNKLWSSEVDPQSMPKRSTGNGGPGPYTTPAVSDGKVYATSTFVKIACFNAADGKPIWKHDLVKEFGSKGDRAITTWGSATSPIIEGDLCIMMGGGDGQTFIAFNKNTGDVVWKKQTETFTQSTPTACTIDGVRQLIFHVQSGLVSIDPKTGEQLWKLPSKGAVAIGASPVVEGNLVFHSVGYNVGGGTTEVKKVGDKFEAKDLWMTSNKNATQWSTSIVKDGFVYMIVDGGGTNGAKLQCLEMKTGTVKWTGPAVGQGELLMIDGKLLVQTSQGALLLVEASPEAFKQISKAQPLTGQAWGVPAFADGILVYRTATDIAAVGL